MVELIGVTKTYPGGVTALRPTDLTILPGELVGVVGPSGSGKSTLLNLVGTLDRPTAGTVRITGHDLAQLSDRQLATLRATTIGFVFQQFHLAPAVSAVDNVADGLLYSGRSRKGRRSDAEQALDRVGLAHRGHHRPHELSGGERQRVAIARAIVGRPALLLADEPTGNLDTATGASIMELLRDLNAGGSTVLVITHDLDVAAALPRQVTVRDGQVRRDTGAAVAELRDATAVAP
ncbi:ABC transporter ATP-binding protein [Catellatospora aurea]|uniref:ABC transporter ATP-binding protein n=1 Tax=Catellatospora aurea TaxID=1337874 RepID=A0ABW2HCU2_9ACTN